MEKRTEMKIKVNNCFDCPLKYMSGYEGEEYSCTIDEKRREVYLRDTKNSVDTIKYETKKEWCPLINENYIVSLKT